MNARIARRDFLKTMALGAGALAVPGLGTAFAKKGSMKPTRKLKIGHTCITWGTFPRPEAAATLDAALKDISAEGFWSYETFPEVLDYWDQKGELVPLMKKYPVPLQSCYITPNLLDPSKRKEEIDRVIRLSKIVQKFKGTYIVLAPNGVKRDTYNFKEHQADIVSALDDYSAAVVDLGLKTGFHQHTGTCVETRDETYAVMNSVNTANLKFAPDVGQLQKGGADAAQNLFARIHEKGLVVLNGLERCWRSRSRPRGGDVASSNCGIHRRATPAASACFPTRGGRGSA